MPDRQPQNLGTASQIIRQKIVDARILRGGQAVQLPEMLAESRQFLSLIGQRSLGMLQRFQTGRPPN